jgi:hypothetical protein
MELRLSIRVFGTNTSTGFWSGNGLVLSEELRRSRGVDWKAPVSARTPAAQLIANFSAMHVELGARPTGAWWPAIILSAMEMPDPNGKIDRRWSRIRHCFCIGLLYYSALHSGVRTGAIRCSIWSKLHPSPDACDGAPAESHPGRDSHKCRGSIL